MHFDFQNWSLAISPPGISFSFSFFSTKNAYFMGDAKLLWLYSSFDLFKLPLSIKIQFDHDPTEKQMAPFSYCFKNVFI